MHYFTANRNNGFKLLDVMIACQTDLWLKKNISLEPGTDTTQSLVGAL